MRIDAENVLYKCLREYKLFVLVMAPLCTGLAGRGKLSAMMNPTAGVSVPLRFLILLDASLRIVHSHRCLRDDRRRQS